MNYTVVDSCEWTYPDVHSYKSSKESFTALALRGGYASCRLLIWSSSGKIRFSVSGADCKIYEEIAIPVEANPNFEKELPHFPEREAPFLVYDCMKPSDGEMEERNGAVSCYLLFPVPGNAKKDICAIINVADTNESFSFDVRITPMGILPIETLKIAMGYSPWEVHLKHHLRFGSKKFNEMDQKYLLMLRYQHQTRLYIDPPDTMQSADGSWHFDYTEFNHRTQQALELGFTGIHIPGVGFRRAWDKPDIVIRGMDALSFEAYAYLSEYMKTLKKNLSENGWIEKDIFSIGIADEPNEYNATTYRAVAGMVRKLFPELKIYDAVSYVPVYGSIDIWVPRSDEYEKNREQFEYFRRAGDEIWHYVCLFPRDGGYMNRFMDIPLLATRYLYWGNYKYGLDGYLHWSVNLYQNDLDPFEGSCPVHINAGSKSILPPGDDRIIYPGTDGPWMSARLEAQRESAEDYEMLRIIALHDKALADKICEKCFRSFTDTELDPLSFRLCHDELIRTYSALTD